jgi:hypothetical protein
MRSVSVSKAGQRGGISTALVIIPLVGGASVLLRALSLEQPLGARTLMLAAVAAAGALLATTPVVALGALLARRWRSAVRATLGALLTAGAFVPATMLVFAVELRLFEGRVEADSVTELSASDVFWTLFGAMGLFTPTGLHYLLPWPMLAVAVAAFICFYRWPKPPAGALS